MTELSFQLPDAAALRQAGATYAISNYQGSGWLPRFKRHRFNLALQMSNPAEREQVIDMGCCDGVLLPTLSAHFKHVVAVDHHPEFVKRSRTLVDALGIKNVTTICNQNTPPLALREQIGPNCRLMFLLETLEHVGELPDLWGSKARFLDECFELLDQSQESRIIASVPKMTGLGFAAKHVVQMLRGVQDDRMPLKDFLRSSLLGNTDNLESRWNGGHVGFNHIKLEDMLSQHFKICAKKENPFSAFYEIGRQ